MRAFPSRLPGLLGFLIVSIAHAASPPVPAPLEPWRAWVLQDQEYRACPLIAGKPGKEPGDFLCAWPGRLSVNADAHGADIAEHWRVDADSWIPLPGDADHWPQQVTVDGRPAPVVNRQGPSLRLDAGSHDVRAHIPWSERPQGLRVPASIGLVALTVDGKPAAPVQRNDEYLTLGRTTSAPEADSVDLRVYRELGDGVPALLTTEIRWSVSGQAREEVVGPVLPGGFEPLALDSGSWPARLDSEGRLHVQVQPGDDTVTLIARATAPLAKVIARVPAAPWPKQEIWSYRAVPELRVTSATSAIEIDPRQADVPDQWQSLPAFALGDGATLTIEERSRGLSPDDRNRLTLDREMWLDFAGDGWFARDHVGGEMVRGWRFDVAPPFTLERADAPSMQHPDRSGESLLVTHGTRPDTTGVEWRTPRVDLAAGVRVAEASSLPVTGWQDTFDRVTTTLHLPNGYRLIAAPGADSAAGSWISRWTLLDVFIAAIIALLAWRLFGVPGAIVAVGYLVLGYQEANAPLWTLLVAIALGLVARSLPEGRLARAAEWTRRGVLVVLVLIALPFVATELRDALHPQLESTGVLDYGLAGGLAPAGVTRAYKQAEFRKNAPREEAAPMAVPAPPPAPMASAESDALATGRPAPRQSVTVTASNIPNSVLIDHYTQSTIVQTGAGEPGWQLGHRYVLSWSGPVLDTQSVRLVIAPPWLVRGLRVVLVALLAWLVVGMVRGARRAPMSAAAIVFALVPCVMVLSSNARAQAFPPQDLLDELRAHLTEAPKCAPGCASIANANVDAKGDRIAVVLEAHAASAVALPIPIDASTTTLRSITVDGVAQDALAQHDGTAWIALPRGVHRIELAYDAAADKISLAFPLRPMRAGFTGDGWRAGGLADDRLLSGTLTLSRARAGGEAGATTTAQQFAPFVRVIRDIRLGLDWSTSANVQRLAPKEGGFTVSVPLLKGEHVTSPGFKVEQGAVTAAIADGESVATWESTLDKSDTLTLTAPALTDRAEVWRILVSPTWHLESSGVPMSADSSTSDATDYRKFEFHPLPGETLTLHVTRPQAVEGATRAIDRVTLQHDAGKRAADSTLDFTMRASQGGEHAITLPADAQVIGVIKDGTALNLRARDGKLSLPVTPGEHRFQIRFREAVAMGIVTRLPKVALGMPAANVDLGIRVPSDRWLLATSGPTTGPAVLYWSELVVMLLVAWALARTKRTPLRLWQWILLGIGFSTFSWLALLVVVAWLFAIDWRARGPLPRSVLAFDVAQVGLVALTVIALLCIAAAIPQGLLGSPDMHVAGNQSTAQALRWFADRTSDALPTASAVSVPLWVYKLAMLAWALWLASALVGWLRSAFAAWTHDGYWRRSPRKAKVDVPAAAPPPPGGS